jgi:phytol kinase
MALASFLVLSGLKLTGGAIGAAPDWPALLLIALAATLLEQLAVAGLDNLSVPLGVAWLWQGCGPVG